MARFGGGWDFKLGVDVSFPRNGSFSVIFNLGFGMIRVSRRKERGQ